MQPTSIESPAADAVKIEGRGRIDGYSWLRVLACFAIVILHTLFASNVYYGETMTDGQVFATKTVEHLLMWPVPCFLMVTGALLLDPGRDVPLRKLFGKYLRRILLALVIFTLIFQILDVIAGEKDTILAGWLDCLFLGHSWAHMWYFYVLTGLYLMMPFYRMVTAQASDKMILYLIGLILVFVSLQPMMDLIWTGTAFLIPTQLIYPVYLFIGYELSRLKIPAWAGGVLFLAFSLGILLLCVGEYRLGMDIDHETSEFLFGYSSILVVGQASGAFLLVSRIRKPAGKLLRSLDDCSFGIYIIHFAGIKIVMKWCGVDPYNAPVLFILLPVFYFAGAYVLVAAYKMAAGTIKGKTAQNPPSNS